MPTTRSRPRAAAPAPALLAATEPDAVAQVLRRLRVVFNAVRKHFRSVEARAGIPGAQVWALALVADHPGIGVGELARAMHVHQSTASNLLRSLMAGGLVRSERAGADRRAVQLVVTAAGRKLLVKAPPPLTGLLPEALGRLDARTLARLDRDLSKLVLQLGADARGEKSLIGGAAKRDKDADS